MAGCGEGKECSLGGKCYADLIDGEVVRKTCENSECPTSEGVPTRKNDPLVCRKCFG